MSEIRDTHFAGFATLETEEICFHLRFVCSPETLEAFKPALHRFLAQRAYDLVAHTILHTHPYWLDALDYDEIPPRIPDLDAWPTSPDTA